MPSALLTTVVVIEEPSRRALTSTPSMTGSCAEVTLPVSAAEPCAWAALASGRLASDRIAKRLTNPAASAKEENNEQRNWRRRTIIPPSRWANGRVSNANGGPARRVVSAASEPPASQD